MFNKNWKITLKIHILKPLKTTHKTHKINLKQVETVWAVLLLFANTKKNNNKIIIRNNNNKILKQKCYLFCNNY